MKTFVEIIVDIPKEDLPTRIKEFVKSVDSDHLDELQKILSSLAFYGAAEAIRWVFFEESSEKGIAETIEMIAAKESPDPDLF